MRFPIASPLLSRTAARLLLAGAGCVLAALPAQGEPRILLGDGDTPAVRFRIGDHLVAGLEGGAPNTAYTLVLYDDAGGEVARALYKTDCAGKAPARLLWAHSGVVGCGPCVAPDPAKNEFASFAEAKERLEGRTFAVELEGPGGQPLAARPVPWVATTEERPFFSDAKGCPRFSFAPLETIYLAFENPQLEIAGRRLFLLPDRGELALGKPLDDLRYPGLPPVLDPQKPVAVWIPGKDVDGAFTGVVRPAAYLETFRIDADMLLGPGGPKTMTGLSITADTAGCPPHPPG